jgi:hypothetical protein
MTFDLAAQIVFRMQHAGDLAKRHRFVRRR